jgi:hypothetical protein
VFSSNDYLTGWNGEFSGEICKLETYAWKINLTTKSGRAMEYSGFVLLRK